MVNKQLQAITEENFLETLAHNKFKPFLFNMYQRTKPEKVTLAAFIILEILWAIVYWVWLH